MTRPTPITLLAALALCACSGSNDASSSGDAATESGAPLGGCHLAMSRQEATNLRVTSLDIGPSEFADARCDAGSQICVLDTHLGLDLDAVVFTFTKPTGAGDSHGLAVAGHDHVEFVQPNASNGDWWISVSGRVNYSAVSSTTGTDFVVMEAGMTPESMTGSNATGTYSLTMTCRGVIISGID